MATINAMLRRVQGFDVNTVIDQAASETINKTEFFEDQLRKQLTAGLDKKGARLRPYRNRAYARKKFAMNPLPGLGNPDLKKSGAYHRGLNAESSGNIITIRASNKAFLIKKYPGAIAGLGGPYKTAFIQHLRPNIIKHIRNRIRI